MISWSPQSGRDLYYAGETLRANKWREAYCTSLSSSTTLEISAKCSKSKKRKVAFSSFNWKMDTGKDSAYSLKNEDYPRLPLFTRKGPACSTALLNPLFWLVFDELSTWRRGGRRRVATLLQR